MSLIVAQRFFQKAKLLWGSRYKNRIHQLGQLELSQFPLKYLKSNLVNLFSITPNGTKKLKISKKTDVWNRVRLSLRGKNMIRNQILVSKLWYIGQIYTIPKYQKGNWKKNMQFPLEQEKIEPPRQWAQLSIWRDRLGILLF